MTAPARAALRAAESAAARPGHEHAGPISLSDGFLPTRPPPLRFGERHAAWDAVVAELPELHASLRVRRRLHALPELSADPRSLPSRYLQRAATVLGILAHAYHRAEPRHSDPTPPSVQRPWEQVCRRLGRPGTFLTYADLIVCNWRPARPDGRGRTVEELQLLVPTVDTPEERVFYLTQVEMLSVGAPLVGAAVSAQEAMLSGDLGALERALEGVGACLRRLVRTSLPKIDPNPYGDTYVDPAVWAKTVAPLAVPLRPGPPGPSGTSSPLFHLLDALLGRRDYDSQLGMEARTLRTIFPPHWAAFLEAVAAHSVADHVAQQGDRAVRDAFADALVAYAGDNGLLERHRRKVYGYIELAFKLGRSVTIGGFRGVFGDRTWERVDAALVASRLERVDPRASDVRRVPVLEVAPAGTAPSDRVRRVVLGTADANLRWAPGDRLRVHPEQPADAVARALCALGASGAEAVRLDGPWRQFAAVVLRSPSLEELALRDLLRHGELGRADGRIAVTLQALAVNARERHVIERGKERRWHLSELLARLAATGWDPRALLTGPARRHHAICDVVPPAAPRSYSIASGADHRLELTVGRPEGEPHGDVRWSGLASADLTRTPADRLGPVAVSPVAAVDFRPPADPRTPMVMVAAGTGVSPFRSFILDRAGRPGCGEMWLLLGARRRSEACYLDELARLTATVPLHLHLALSREDERRLDGLLRDDDIAPQLWRLLREPAEGGAGAVMYVCGAPGVAATVADSVRDVFRRHEPAPAADLRFRRLVARRRYREEVFATPAGPTAARRFIPVSELVLHAAEAPQPWIALHGGVYDITDFRHLHPGGRTLLDGYAGIDATRAFERVGHSRAPDIMARLATYEVERLLRCAPDDIYDAWVKTLFLSVELDNARRADIATRRGRTTAARPPGALTPHAVQLAIDAHERFGHNVIDDLLGAPLDALRRFSANPTDHVSPVVPASAPQLFAALDDAVARDQADTLRHLDRACQALLAADGDLLSAVTSTLRAGVQVLERTPRRDVRPAELLTILDQIVPSLRAYANRVQHVIDDVAPPSPARAA